MGSSDMDISQENYHKDFCVTKFQKSVAVTTCYLCTPVFVTRTQGFYLMTPKIQFPKNVSVILQQPIMWVEMDIELWQL
jgi:hypothetical protein